VIAFEEFLTTNPKIILDGATGTELNRRGVDTGLPLWSANALLTDAGQSVLRQVHSDYLRAGADITRRAVDIARQAIAGQDAASPRFVAGSISTLEDCYRSDLVPPDDACRTEHSERVHHLLEAGADLFLIETMNSIREASIAARLAAITGTPVIVSFVCDPYGRILSGESLGDAARELLPLGIRALGVNCGPTPYLKRPLDELQAACPPGFPLIAYGNIGFADEHDGWVNTDAVDPEAYCRHAATWPAHIVGGCCGTTPEHIARLRLSI
jgi:S-methylmethionine-dependent homocysteine/selenocysteine methylase